MKQQRTPTPEEIIAAQPNEQEKEKQLLMAYIRAGHCNGCDGFKYSYSLFCSNCMTRLEPEWKDVIFQTPVYSTTMVKQIQTIAKYLNGGQPLYVEETNG